MAFEVIRNFQLDYILFYTIFLLFFIFLLIKKQKSIALYALLLGGLLNLVIDWGIWYKLLELRQVILPDGFLSTGIGIFLFFIWFSIAYGIEYSFVFLMFRFEMKDWMWALLILSGWILVGFVSNLIPLSDSLIFTSREMGDLRFIRYIIFGVGYLTLFIMKYKPKKILYLFIIGFAIHGMMELSLLLNGIRPFDLSVLIENSIIEFNMGVPFFYILYDKYLKRFEK